MVQADGQVVVVNGPQLLEGELGLPAGVHEDQGDLGLLDLLVDRLHRVEAGVAHPRHGLAGHQDFDGRLGPARALHDGDLLRRARRKPSLQPLRLVDGGREAHAAHLRGEALQAGEAEVEQVAALAGVQHMDLVQDHAAQVAEILARALPGAEQGELFGCGEEDVGRRGALALALGLARVAGATLDGDGQAHLGDGDLQIARHVHGQRLQGRDVEGVHAAAGRVVGGRPVRQLDQARQEAGQGLAAARGGDEEGVLALPGGVDHGELVGARAPAAGGEPVGEDRRERR